METSSSSGRAVAHPRRLRPTVFLGGIAIALLPEYLRAPLTIQETLRIWSQKIHTNQVEGVLSWLWENDVIVEVA
jgi:hypothetical protein